MLKNILEYLSKPIYGLIIGVWGVWLGIIQHYLGNSNGIPIMLVGISCLVIASISSNTHITAELKKTSKSSDETPTVTTNTYITK